MSAQRVPAVLVVDDFNPFSRLIRHVLRQRRFAVFCASSAAKGLALFQAHRSQIDLAVIDMVRPVAANLDLTAELERLQPGLPVLYLVGALKTVARCSIEAQAPGSVLAAPFTEKQLIASRQPAGHRSRGPGRAGRNRGHGGRAGGAARSYQRDSGAGPARARRPRRVQVLA